MTLSPSTETWMFGLPAQADLGDVLLQQLNRCASMPRRHVHSFFTGFLHEREKYHHLWFSLYELRLQAAGAIPIHD